MVKTMNRKEEIQQLSQGTLDFALNASFICSIGFILEELVGMDEEIDAVSTILHGYLDKKSKEQVEEKGEENE